MSKVQVNSPQEFKQVSAMNKLHMAMNQVRRLSFGGYNLSGGDPFADMKHGKAWFDYGYPFTVDFYMQWNMYQRNGLARAGINIPASLTWLDYPTIKEGDGTKTEETLWTKGVKKLLKQKRVWRHLADADRMQMVGRYSALFFRVRDGLTPDQHIKLIKPEMLIEIQPIWEGQLIPALLDNDLKSDRLGRPVTYTYQETGVGNQNALATQSFTIHHSRLIILSENAVGGSIYGEPANEAGFNALLDWDKIRGSGGEASWLAAANKQVLTSDNPNATVTNEVLDAINDALKDMKEGLDEAVFMKGVTATPMGATVPDPKVYKEMALEEYAASRMIPVKILVGTQTGVKAGDEDTAGYMRQIQSRRCNKVTPMIEDCINWLMRHGVIPQVEEFTVEWSDLTAPSAMQKADCVLKLTQAEQARINAGEGPMFEKNELRKELGFQEMKDQLVDLPDMPDESKDNLAKDEMTS